MKSRTSRSISPKQVKKYATSVGLQRKKLLAEWVKFIFPSCQSQLVEENIKTGVIPYKLIQHFRTNMNLRGFQQNPNQSQAYSNLLLINNYLFQEFPNSELPSPNEMMKKGSNDCWGLVNTIFKNFELAEIKKNWGKTTEWYVSIIKLYGFEINKESLLKTCLNGVYFACILNCYTGFNLAMISKQPKGSEVTRNICLVSQLLKEKIFFSLDFEKNLDEDFTALTVYSVFKLFRFEFPTLPTREKVQFKGKPQLVLNTTDSLLSVSSWCSLEYSKSTILSKEPSEVQLAQHTTPKWSREKPLEIVADDSTGYSMQPYEVSYEAVSIANTSYTKRTSDKLTKLEAANAKCERELMYISDLRTKKEKLQEVPSLKKLRIDQKVPELDFLYFLITPRVLKMIRPESGNFVFTVVMNLENFSASNESYAFEWKNFALAVKGKVNLNDICNCENSGRVLEVKTFNEEWIVQCLDEKEAEMYVNGLNNLIKRTTLFSRDVSCNELILNIR